MDLYYRVRADCLQLHTIRRYPIIRFDYQPYMFTLSHRLYLYYRVTADCLHLQTIRFYPIKWLNLQPKTSKLGQIIKPYDKVKADHVQSQGISFHPKIWLILQRDMFKPSQRLTYILYGNCAMFVIAENPLYPIIWLNFLPKTMKLCQRIDPYYRVKADYLQS